jgi:hypothetical protein
VVSERPEVEEEGEEGEWEESLREGKKGGGGG